MQKLLASFTTALVFVSLAMALFAGPALAADIVTIPLDKRLPLTSTPNMNVRLIQVTISDTTYGGVFAPDPAAVLFPVLVYEFENHGSTSQTGHLYVIFTDDKGDTYEARDPGMLDPVKPGNKSSPRILEIAIPKDRKLTKLTVVQGFEQTDYELAYPSSSSPQPTSGPTGGASPTGGATPGQPCLGSLALPLLLVGGAWIGGRLLKK